MKNIMLRKILSIDKDPDMPVGMGGYGVRFEKQREYYTKLSFVDKQHYQEAILQLCQSPDVYEANLGLYIAVELRDVFLANWVEQIRKVINSLIGRPIIPQDENTASFVTFVAIFVYGDKTVLPYVIAYLKEITRSMEDRILPKENWLVFYPLLCQILIKISPAEFWEEVNVFCDNVNTLAIIGDSAKQVIRRWAGIGIELYGVEWLAELAQKCAKTQNASLKPLTYQSLKEAASGIEEKGNRIAFLELLEDLFYSNRGAAAIPTY